MSNRPRGKSAAFRGGSRRRGALESAPRSAPRAIQDKLPDSRNEDIQVEMLPSTTPPTTTNLRDKRGVLEWAFETKPGEAKDIAFAWRVRWPKDKGIVMTPAG